MNERIKNLKQEVRDVLESNILRFWLDKMIDRENGGFYGRIDGHGTLHPEARHATSRGREGSDSECPHPLGVLGGI